MEFEVHNIQKIKLVVHIVQLVLIFVSWVLEIVVFRSSANIDGRPGWYFGLVCSLSPPSIGCRWLTERVHSVF